MQGDTAIVVFERCKFPIQCIVWKLMRQLDYYCPIEEVMSDTQEKWVSCFSAYEDDKQYLRYIFVVMKNKIRDLKRIKWRYERMHISDPAKLNSFSEEGDTGHVRVWNEMAVDTKEESPPIRVEIQETISMIEDHLTKKFHKDIFKLMIEGLPHKAIAEELGCSVGHVAKTKKDIIWPVVKDVMRLPEDKYAVLIDSGRIYSY